MTEELFELVELSGVPLDKELFKVVRAYSCLQDLTPDLNSACALDYI